MPLISGEPQTSLSSTKIGSSVAIRAANRLCSVANVFDFFVSANG